MKPKVRLATALALAVAATGMATAQGVTAKQPAQEMAYNTQAPSAQTSALPPALLEWTPPALAQLSAQATMHESFTLDRTLLGLAAGMVPDSDEDERSALRKLDGVSVHTMRFGEAGIPDESEVDAIRAAYHLPGWKHVVSSVRSGGPVHDNTTDVWVVLNGMNLRGAVVLAETPRSLTLVTVAGNLSPIDLLHLRGHFGIPRFDSHDPHDRQIH